MGKHARLSNQRGMQGAVSAITCFRQAAGLQSDCPSAFPWYHTARYLSTVPKFPKHLIVPILARCVSDMLSFSFSISISLGKVKIFSNHFRKVWMCIQTPACCYCSVTKSCLTLCNPTDCTMTGSSVFHCLLEFAQIHVH